MTYQAWTAKDIEYRLLEAMETLMLLPAIKGPNGYGSSMPEIAMTKTEAWLAGATATSRYKRRPDRDAIDRMPVTWGWINTTLSEAERKLIYGWARAKVSNRRRIARYAEKMGFTDRTMRRRITALFQKVANALNQRYVVCATVSLADVSEISTEIDPEVVSSVKYATHWRAEDARPEIMVSGKSR